VKALRAVETNGAASDDAPPEVTVIRGPGRDGRNLDKVNEAARSYAEHQLFGMLDASAGRDDRVDAGLWLARKKAAYRTVLDMLERRDLREHDIGCIGDEWRAGLSIAWGRRNG